MLFNKGDLNLIRERMRRLTVRYRKVEFCMVLFSISVNIQQQMCWEHLEGTKQIIKTFLPRYSFTVIAPVQF